jgi:ABC-type uncharacterized transport system ATPase subunit
MLLELSDIVKRFGPVVANAGARLDVEPGEIHALLGENGAGKTTLMRIAAGLVQPDAGEILWQGQPVVLRSPAHAAELGIQLVHQHDMLVPGLTVEDNLRLGHRSSGFLLRRDGVVQRFRERARRYGLEVDPSAPVEALSVGQRQWVSLLRALDHPLRVLALDEPTASLSPVERDALFDTLRQLRAEGMGIVFITHKLREVTSLADRVTVMRGGRTVATLPVETTSEEELARMMVGERTPPSQREVRGSGTAYPDFGEPLLDVDALSTERTMPRLQGVTLTIRRGEIVGIGGVGGNGQDVLFRCLAGQNVGPRRGTVRVLGAALAAEGGATFARVARIPEDRLREGIAGGMTLWENVHLGRARPRGLVRRGLWRVPRAKRMAEELLSAFSVRHESLEQEAWTLSGGNQQRLVLARELGDAPDLVLANNPTRGLDIQATSYVLEQLRRIRDRGGGVLLISYDLDELLEVADRILVMAAGRIVRAFESSEFDPQEIGLAMGGVVARRP